MNKVFNIGRLVWSIGFAKGLWYKNEDTYLLHLGIWRKGEQSAIKLTILSFTFMMGWANVQSL